MKRLSSGRTWAERIPTWLEVLLAYLVLSLVFFGAPVLRAPNRVLLGSGDDPSLFMWMLAWWPHAIGHGLNPFLTHALFSPDGFNLAWTTSIPGPSLVLAPVTLVAGAVVTFNALALLSPALSAFTAFLLCRHVTGRVAASIVGGYVFGFSGFVLGALAGGHLHLALSALLPVCALLVVRHIDGSLGSRRFVILLAACLVGQFLISIELLVLMAVFGGFALLVAAVVSERRDRIVRTVGLIAAALLAMAVVVSPLLYYAFFEPGTPPRAYPAVYAADLANFVVPTALTGPAHSWFTPVARAFRGNITEQGAYLGVPFLAAVGLYAAAGRKSAGDWALVLTFVLAAAMSLGTRLHVAGVAAHPTMPWDLMQHLPVARYALPSRSLAFVFLAAAVMIALWLSRRSSVGRWVLVGLGVAAVLPNRGFARYHDGYTPPRFITAGQYEHALTTRDRVLILPAHRGGRPMRWQAETGIHFELAQGYVSRYPRSFARWPIVAQLRTNRLRRDAAGQLRRFVRAKRVTVVLVDRRHPGPWSSLLARMHIAGTAVDGVLLYRLRPR